MRFQSYKLFILGAIISSGVVVRAEPPSSVLSIKPQAAVSEKHELVRGIQMEFEILLERVHGLEPDGAILETTYFKYFGDTVLIWRTRQTNPHSTYDYIRIQRERPDGSTFDVSYYGNAHHLIEGHRVLRRFVGTFGQQFRNDTLDMDTGFYFGAQGVKTPRLDSRDHEILKEWSIVLYP